MVKDKTKTIAPVAEIEKEFTLPYESFVEIGIDLKGNPKDFDDWPLEQKVRKDG